MSSSQKVLLSAATHPLAPNPTLTALSPSLRGKASLRVSLHIETKSGLVTRRGTYTRRALHAARCVIRQRGFTILQAYAATFGCWQPDEVPPGFSSVAQLHEAHATWREANTAAARVWDQLAPVNCPRWPVIRMVVAVRAKPAS